MGIYDSVNPEYSYQTRSINYSSSRMLLDNNNNIDSRENRRWKQKSVDQAPFASAAETLPKDTEIQMEDEDAWSEKQYICTRADRVGYVQGKAPRTLSRQALQVDLSKKHRPDL